MVEDSIKVEPIKGKIANLFNGLSNIQIEHNIKKLEEQQSLNLVQIAPEENLDNVVVRSDHHIANTALAQKRQRLKDDKATRHLLYLSILLKQKDENVQNTLKSIAVNLDKVIELDQRLLDQINNIHEHIENLKQDQELVELLLQDEDLKNRDYKAVKSILNRFKDRNGISYPENDNGIRKALNEQVRYEQTILIPALQSKSYLLSSLHEGTLEEKEKIEKSVKNIEERRLFIRDLEKEEDQSEAYDKLQLEADQILEKSNLLIKDLELVDDNISRTGITMEIKSETLKEIEEFKLESPIFNLKNKPNVLKP